MTRLSVVVLATGRSDLLPVTLRAAARAADAVRATGWSVELMLATGDAGSPTSGAPDETEGSLRRVGAPSGSRAALVNAGVREARGEVVALCAAGELVTGEFLTAALRLLAVRGPRAVVHPGGLLEPGSDGHLLRRIPSTDDSAFTHCDLIDSDPWPTASVAPRALHQEIPHRDLEAQAGFGPEGQLWSLDTCAAGIAHLTVPSALVRLAEAPWDRRDDVLLPFFDVRRVREALAPPLAPSAGAGAPWPAAFPVRAVRFAERKLRALARRGRAAILRRRPGAAPVPPPIAIEDARRSLAELASIEPLLSPQSSARIDLVPGRRDRYAEILSSLCDRLADSSDVLVLTPSVGLASEDRIPLDYAWEFAREPQAELGVTILTTAGAERTRSYLIPPVVKHQQLDDAARTLPAERRRRLLAQLVVLVAPRVVLAIDSAEFEEALEEWGTQLTAVTDVRLYLTRPARNGAAGSGASRAALFTGDEGSATMLAAEMAVPASSVRIHPHPALDAVPDFDTVVQYTAAHDDVDFSAEHPFRVLWPHRIEDGMNVEALMAVARRARELGLPVEFGVHTDGAPLSPEGRRLLPRLEELGILHHGEYGRGLLDVPTETYHAFLLTASPAGLPITVVQALLLGLPVVAGASPALASVIRHGETGLLTEGPDDADGYAEALRSLIESRDLRRRLIRNGYTLARERQDPEAFRTAVRKDFAELWGASGRSA